MLKAEKYKKIVIGIDESYARCGISIAIDGKLVRVGSESFKGCTCKAMKRLKLRKIISKIIQNNRAKAIDFEIYVERIRTLSQGPKGSQGFGLKPDYLKATGALIATIVDEAFLYGVPVYSIDTRSWKSKILGSSTTDKAKYKDFEKPEKATSILFIQKQGFDMVIYNKDGSVKMHTKGKDAGKIYYDDDAADSGCIALYGFLPKKLQNLKLEE